MPRSRPTASAPPTTTHTATARRTTHGRTSIGWKGQWLADFDHDPLDGLDAPTVRTLRLAFSRRHLLEHNGGVIDERYKREGGEGSIGRRVRITPAFVDQALAAVVTLAGRLEATAR